MERYEPFGLITEQKARKKIAECFPNTATLYAVLDYAVCFGTYNQGSFSLGIEAQTEPDLSAGTPCFRRGAGIASGSVRR